ncbi:hypothetical protein [Streptomyces sp. TLI_105]|uniref:hypothetical protein n=1 Tax=Streptomyces sp. TLI_105 TaxID=1881019 RepID=UPI00089C0AB5|nr:hypothetical protein [Streptomyces sp. TLI_105]SEE21194.1 hypothetical protein SAMN05428939_7738 [Streptomyces sp. TLI_105]
MHVRQRVAGTVAALALAASGLSAAAPTASASASAPSALSCSARLITGSGGHRGAEIRCTGSSFTGVVDCKRTDNGYVYRHFGNRVPSGGTSTVWCDLNATVIQAYGTPS